jgi:large subunit ribosomal protein LP1
MSADLAKTAIPYALLLLTDAGVEITEERVIAVLTAAGIDTIEPVWVAMFVKTLKNEDVERLCKSVSAGTGAAASTTAAAAPAAAADAAPAKADSKKAAPKEEEVEEDMGFSLFD